MFLINEFPIQAQMLSKTQMYQDYDQLINIFENCNPQVPIRRALTNVDQIDILKNFRKNIDTITNINSFYKLLNTSLYYMFDEHITMATQIYTFEEKYLIDTSIVEKQRYENEYELQNSFNKIDPYEPFCNPVYISGEYYMKGCYLFSNNISSSIHLCNPKIISYDGQSYGNYVLNKKPFGLRWDNNLKKHYATKSSFPKKGVLVVSNFDKVIEIDMNNYRNVEIIGDSNYVLDVNNYFKKNRGFNNRVEYFVKEKILYIHLDKMIDDNKSFANKVIEKGKEKEINKIIIDVRNNYGGNDIGWKYLIRAIIFDTIKDECIIAVLNTPEILNRYKYSKTINNIEKWEIKTYNIIPKIQYLVSRTSPEYYIPDSLSLQYKGKIYVIQDENTYSSAQAFCSFANKQEQFITVGTPIGMIGGRALSAELFQLKNSKFTFRMGTTIEIYKEMTIYDFYNDYPEINIVEPYKEKLKRFNHTGNYDLFQYNYLIHQDYIFKKILEL